MSVEEFEREGKPKRKINRKIILRILIILALLAGVTTLGLAGYHMYKVSIGTFTGYDVVTSSPREDGTSTVYSSYEGKLMKYSRDGAQAYTSELGLLWNGTYEMKNPVMDQCGSYVVIGDRGQRLVHIFNGAGMVNSITVDRAILKVQIANQGVTAVLAEEEDKYYITFYDKSGNFLFEQMLLITGSGYPLDFALSNDGTKVVISCLDVNTGKVKMNVGYYNLTDVGDNYENNFVGGNSYDDMMIAKVDFMTNNIVCLYRDNGFILQEMVQKPADEPIADVTFDQEIISVFSNSSYVGFVLAGEEGQDKYQVVVYNLKGSKVLSTGINFEYSRISMADSQIVFYTYSQCMVLTLNGKIHFETTFDTSIDYMYPADKNRYYLVTSDSIEIIQIKGAK